MLEQQTKIKTIRYNERNIGVNTFLKLELFVVRFEESSVTVEGRIGLLNIEHVCHEWLKKAPKNKLWVDDIQKSIL